MRIDSDKQGAATTYKRGYGFHPLMACLDATGEALAALLRPGNAGSATTQDHITVLDDDRVNVRGPDRAGLGILKDQDAVMISPRAVA